MPPLAKIEVADEYEAYLDDVVLVHTDRFGNRLPPWERGDARFHTTLMDYADLVRDRGPDCSEWCSFCNPPHIDWMEWLRAQDVYPPPPLSRPFIDAVTFV